MSKLRSLNRAREDFGGTILTGPTIHVEAHIARMKDASTGSGAITHDRKHGMVVMSRQSIGLVSLVVRDY